jgi:hypothetical protein
MGDGLLVALQGAPLWNLATPAETSQNLPDMAVMIFDSELPTNHARNAFQCPQVIRKAIGQCAFQQYVQKKLGFPLLEFSGATTDRLEIQTSVTTIPERLVPPVNRGGGSKYAPRHFCNTEATLQERDRFPSPTF